MSSADSETVHDVSNEDAEFPSLDGTRLYRRSSFPRDSISWARLVILHGYGDHSGRYAEFMRWMAARGVACHAIDFRGHGRAGGRHAYVNRWEDYLDDLRAFLALPQVGPSPAAPESTAPFLLGHSHGGLIVAAAVIDGVISPAGCVLSSPYLRGAMPVNAFWRAVAFAGDCVMPWAQVRSGLEAEMMSHDPAMIDDSRHDPLLLHCATPRWYRRTLVVQRRVMREAPRFRVPLLCIAAGADVVADSSAAQSFADAAGSADKTFTLVAKRKHELLREVGREQTFQTILCWIRERARRTA